MKTTLIQKLKQQPRLGQTVGKDGITRDAAGNPISVAPATTNTSTTVTTNVNAVVASKPTPISTPTYTVFDSTDIITQQKETVTAGMWSNNAASLTTYFTSSTQTNSQRQYYVDVYNLVPTATGSAVQFSIAYGHRLGSGSNSVGQLNDSPSRAVYSQYRQVLLPPSDTQFTTAGSGSTDSIYVISFKRDRIKERMDPGNFEIPLVAITSRTTNATGSVVTGSGVITLIDDSVQASPTIGEMGRVYNIVSGSISNKVYNPTSPEYYGLVYPDYGIMILDGKMLDNKLGFKTNVSSSSEANNHFVMFNSISGSAIFTNSAGDKFGFQARNTERISSTHYFVRVKNGLYNYSNNPSFVTGSNGDVITPFRDDPKTYVTTVGLYNDNQDLLAVAKLSKPLLKSFTRESLIRIKLDF
jgi:hypothetical protein